LKELSDYFSSYDEIIGKHFYFGVETGLEWSESLQKEIVDAGFDLHSKEVKWVPVSLEKSHFKKVIKELFDVLDDMKTSNSEIANRLYELRSRIESRLSITEPDFDSDGSVQGGRPPYAPEDEEIYNSIYDLIEELDTELKKLNINIDGLQNQLSIPVKRRKCDFDVEIARDVFNLSNDFECLIIFSGDGDYAALVEDIISKGKRAIVVFAKGHKGKEYEDFTRGVFLCSVDRLKNDIRKK